MNNVIIKVWFDELIRDTIYDNTTEFNLNLPTGQPVPHSWETLYQTRIITIDCPTPNVWVRQITINDQDQLISPVPIILLSNPGVAYDTIIPPQSAVFTFERQS